MPYRFLMLGSINGLLAVALGAFGAHGLKNLLDAQGHAWWETAVHYHGLHALALLAVGIVALHGPSSRPLRWAGWAFTLGIVLFCGSLYALALTGVRGLGAITPLGGVAFLIAWGSLAYHANHMKRLDKPNP